MVCRLLSVNFCDYLCFFCRVLPLTYYSTVQYETNGFLSLYCGHWKSFSPVLWHHIRHLDDFSSVYEIYCSFLNFGWIDIIIYSNSTTLFFKDDVILLTSFPRWHQNCNSQAFIWYCGSIWLFHSTKQHYRTDTSYFCCNLDLCFLCRQVVFTAMLPIIHSNFIFSKN